MAHSGMGASCDCDNVPLSPQVLPFVNDRGGSLEDLVLPGVPGPSRVAGCAEFQGVWPILGNTATGGSPIHPVGASAAAAGPCPSVPFPPARKPQKLTDGPQVHAGENKAICGSCWPLSLSLSLQGPSRYGVWGPARHLQNPDGAGALALGGVQWSISQGGIRLILTHEAKCKCAELPRAALGQLGAGGSTKQRQP